MQVTIVGAGYVGLTTGVTLAYLGHKVNIVDCNFQVIKSLNQGKATIHEFGLEALLGQVQKDIRFTTSFSGLTDSEIVIIAVGTPSLNNGDADLSFLESAVTEVLMHWQGHRYPLIINKSTVPPGTACRINTLANQNSLGDGPEPGIMVVSNPEFLREGNALYDALYPDRIILGAHAQVAFDLLQKLYRPLIEQVFTPPEFLPRPRGYTGPTVFRTDPVSAELIKYASNAFLSMKISFINEFAGLAELLNADIIDVSRGMGLDQRIGDKFLQAGVGWGGSCFGKDARAIIQTASKYGYPLPLVKTAVEVNQRQRKSVINKLCTVLKTVPGSTVGILGLSFKPGTDDVRDAPATDVIEELLNMGVFIRVYDPVAMDNYRKQFPDLKVKYTSSLEELATGCDALVLLTEWNQFKNAPWEKLLSGMKGEVFVDGRNLLEPELMYRLGYVYRGVGRRVGSVHEPGLTTGVKA